MDIDISSLESVLTKVIANLPEAVLIVDRHSNILFVNKWASELFGYAPEEIIGGKLDVLLPDALSAKHKEHVKKFVAEKSTSRRMGENRRVSGVKKNGVEFPAEASIAHIQLDDGQAYGMVIMRDISGRVLDKKSLGRFLETAAVSSSQIAALDTLEDSIVILDENWCYSFVNKEGLRRLGETRVGRRKSDILGQNVWKLFPHLKGTKFEENAMKARENQSKISFEEYYDESKSWYKTDIYPSEKALVFHIRDISEQKKTEEINKRLTNALDQALDGGERRREYRDHSNPARWT